MYGFDNEEPEQIELSKVIDINKLLPMEMPSPEEMKWYESTRKIDANDLSAELGHEGFRQWLIDNLRKAPVVHRSLSKIRSFRELRHYYPELREPVIDGLLRRGEIMNIIAAPKKGKSYLGLGLAMSVIQANSFWLGTFATHQGATLIIDNELHKETCVDRTRTVAEHLGIPLTYVDQWLDFLPLRGELLDIFTLEKELYEVRPGDYKLVVLDALYRFMPPRTDENDNGAMALIFNQLDKMAKKMDCAIAIIHHTSKGLQSFKSVTDVGAGAGSQSRAADAHVILRENRDESLMIVEAVNRSFPPVKSFCIRFKYPIWELDPNGDPTAYKESKQETKTAAKDEANKRLQNIMNKILAAITKPMTLEAITSLAHSMDLPGFSKFRMRNQVDLWVGSGLLKVSRNAKGRSGAEYINASITTDQTQKSDEPVENNSEPTDEEIAQAFDQAQQSSSEGEETELPI